MNIEKIIAGLSSLSRDERDRVRANADKLLNSGNAEQQAAAIRMIAALEEQLETERKDLLDRLSGMTIPARVFEAFRADPMTETESKIVQALLDNPGSTSSELSQVLGWGGQSWHMHFGTMCAKRANYLWPAPKSDLRSADFYSGILADLSSDNRWTMKPEVALAFSELGLRS